VVTVWHSPAVAGLVILAAISSAAIAQGGDAVAVGRGLVAQARPSHPRLMLTAESLATLKATVAGDPLAGEWYDKLRDRAEKMLPEPPIEHVLIGPRLLDKSRRCLDRVATWALVYRLSGDARFLDRARQEMLAAAAFADWNPSHFLDTAEMTHALAIGYDWLYADLSEEDRATIGGAIVDKGLRLGEKAYSTRPMAWWTSCRHNWNQVCNGGLGIGALAVADEEPELAALIVGKAVTLLPLAMAEYGPDGGWAEGPGYWSYATHYTVYFLAALETATGSDAGLCAIPGFADAGGFRTQSIGPTGKVFNYADAGEGAGQAACMLWLARRFSRPEYAATECARVTTPTPWHLLWYDAALAAAPLRASPPDMLYRGVNVAFLRSSWDDPNATFVGFKGGDNRANHSHLDLGTFVLDALGVRWAVDLGGDDYNLPGYFGDKRWDYYRLRTEGHNTLTIDGRNQDERAVAPIVDFGTTPTGAYAVADLTAAYSPTCGKVARRVQRVQRDVVVTDTIEAPEGTPIVWALHTREQVTLRGSMATLTRGDAHLGLVAALPRGATWETLDANPPPPQAQNPDVTKLVLRATVGTEPLVIRVVANAYTGELAVPLGLGSPPPN
jgi:hypothetical protein